MGTADALLLMVPRREGFRTGEMEPEQFILALIMLPLGVVAVAAVQPEFRVTNATSGR